MKHGETAFTLKAGEMAWKCHQGYGLGDVVSRWAPPRRKSLTSGNFDRFG